MAIPKGKGTSSGQSTEYLRFKVVDEHERNGLYFTRAEKPGHYAFFLGSREDPMIGQIVLRDISAPGKQIFELVGLHVKPEFRNKKVGTVLHNVVRKSFPDAAFVVRPDAYKDRSVSNENLVKVYKAYGYSPLEGARGYLAQGKLLPGGEGTETVRAYTRKDGTEVRSHTRSG